MEESEKMMGLKKAYAEIILNTAKEAAARIMMSEKRVQQVNHDLSSTKDEALRLLLRLKQTMDSKLNEAEMKSQHQQRRIEELEAQLQEAEDVVSNLRAELNEAHDKIEEMEKNNQIRTLPNMTEEAVLATQVKEQSNTTMEDCTTTRSLEENGYLRSKNPEVCVNGCTQRVHAYEGSLANGHIDVGGELDDIKEGEILEEGLEGGKIYKRPLIGSDFAYMVGKKRVSVVDVNNGDVFGCTGHVANEFRKKRKFGARRRRNDTSLLKSLPPMDKEPRFDVPNSPNCLPSSHDVLEIRNVEVKDTGTLPGHVVDTQDDDDDDEVAKAQTNAMEEDKELELNNTSSTSLDAKFQNRDEHSPNLQPKDRVLKYTFQRKRKKVHLSGDDVSLGPEDSLPNHSLGAESSRDSRRMAQVARQLISLSEKKWWK